MNIIAVASYYSPAGAAGPYMHAFLSLKAIAIFLPIHYLMKVWCSLCK